MDAGNSHRSLAEKLGIKPGFLVLHCNAPKDFLFLLEPLPENVTIKQSSKAPADMVHYFTTSTRDLAFEFPSLVHLIKPDGMVWISWPKRSSGIKTDLNENIVRAIGLENTMVDVKVASINGTWSALKFVFRLKDR